MEMVGNESKGLKGIGKDMCRYNIQPWIDGWKDQAKKEKNPLGPISGAELQRDYMKTVDDKEAGQVLNQLVKEGVLIDLTGDRKEFYIPS